MLLMEEIYHKLRQEQLVETAEDFSENWCERSKSWYGVQKGSNSDLSIPAAIACWRKTQVRLALAYMRRKQFGGIVDSQIETLTAIRNSLDDYLADVHGIGNVTLPKAG